MYKTLSSSEKLILSSTKLVLQRNELELINDLITLVQDWDLFANTIIERGIGPLFYKKLSMLKNSGLIPGNVKNKLQQSYLKTLSRSMVFYNAFAQLGIEFNKNDIPFIALKGIFLSEWLYQDIGLRQFSDIDLLVKEEDGLNCIAMFVGLGYSQSVDLRTDFVKSHNEIIHYAPMIKEGVSIEIHIKLHRYSERYHIIIDEFWRNARLVNINTIPVLALCDKDLLIHLCIHLDKHFRDGHVQFTCFNDITNLLEKVGDTFNWEDFVNTCRLHKSEDVVFLYIVLVNKYMHARVPEYVIAQYSYLLTEAVEIDFIKYLNGFTTPFSGVPFYVGNLKKLTSFSDKFRYVWELVIPHRTFMKTKYNIKDHHMVIFYYPYHWWIGAKGLIKLLFNL